MWKVYESSMRKERAEKSAERETNFVVGLQSDYTITSMRKWYQTDNSLQEDASFWKRIKTFPDTND